MKRTATTKIVDLPSEILRHILLIVAISSEDGLATVAKFMCTSKEIKEVDRLNIVDPPFFPYFRCKAFREVASSNETLKALPFDESSPFISKQGFWNQAALLNKSVHAGNPSALAITQKRIMELLSSANERMVSAHGIIEDAIYSLDLGGTSEDLLTKFNIVGNTRRIMIRANLEILRAERIRDRAGL